MIIDHERRLDRKQAAQFLTDFGYRTAHATLAKLACIGGGPTFESFGRKPLYREADLLAWAGQRPVGRGVRPATPATVASRRRHDEQAPLYFPAC